MPRTIAALYDSRAEAEFARSRLVSRLKARSPRIIGKDTVAAVDGLDFAPEAADSYRESLRGGGYLLVAQVPNRTRPNRIIEVLEQAAGRPDLRADQHWGDEQLGVRVDLSDEMPSSDAPELPQVETSKPPESSAAPAEVPREDRARNDERTPQEELPVAREEMAPAGARVRSFTHDAPAEEQVLLNDELVEVETRPSERQLSESEIEAGGLFKDRVFEIAEMREEPVVTKVSVVRDEVIVRKKVKQRSETIRDTVRQTEIEVEDLASLD
jgi:stress response protein YsnF